jgi:hypothetical protein
MTDSSLPARVADNQSRERVVQLLSEHFAEDRLALDELERRLELAYKAGTVAELDALVADLPHTPTPSRALTAEQVAAAPPEERIVAVLSSSVRHGGWLVPARLRIIALFGNAELDLRDAHFAPGVSEIHVSAIFGNVEITVPPGVRVENNGSAILGNFEINAGANSAQPDVVLRITGRAVFGNVETNY